MELDLNVLQHNSPRKIRSIQNRFRSSILVFQQDQIHSSNSYNNETTRFKHLPSIKKSSSKNYFHSTPKTDYYPPLFSKHTFEHPQTLSQTESREISSISKKITNISLIPKK